MTERGDLTVGCSAGENCFAFRNSVPVVVFSVVMSIRPAESAFPVAEKCADGAVGQLRKLSFAGFVEAEGGSALPVFAVVGEDEAHALLAPVVVITGEHHSAGCRHKSAPGTDALEGF